MADANGTITIAAAKILKQAEKALKDGETVVLVLGTERFNVKEIDRVAGSSYVETTLDSGRAFVFDAAYLTGALIGN